MLPRLYAILDVDALQARGLHPETVCAAWLDAGVRLVQLRAKRLSTGALLALTDRLVAQARPARARLIVNDRADVAAQAGAAGVHVGARDLSPREVRRIAGRTAIVGSSAHAPGEVAAALHEPIDYVAIGAVYRTPRKPPDHPVVGLAGVRAAAPLARAAGRPLVAIGGITLERAGEVLDAGASAIAVIGDLLSGDPARRVAAWLDALRAYDARTRERPPV